MKVAIVGAGFTPSEADQLRRAMATFKFTGGVGEMDFDHQTGRGDGARHAGSPDRGDPGWRPRDSYWPPHAEGMDPEEVVRVKTRDFR